MTRTMPTFAAVLLVVALCLTGGACRLKRPDTISSRMIEPQVLAPAPAARRQTTGEDAVPVRLLSTQARAHIGLRVLHQELNGELIADPVWRWSSAPDRYLDTALRLEMESNPRVRLVDSGSAATLAATLLVWDLEGGNAPQLAGTVEFQFMGADREVRTFVARGAEPVGGDLPGNLATAAGLLLRRLAAEGAASVSQEP